MSGSHVMLKIRRMKDETGPAHFTSPYGGKREASTNVQQVPRSQISTRQTA